MAGFAPPNLTAQVDPKTRIDEKVDYSNLPCPKPYEEIHREAITYRWDQLKYTRFQVPNMNLHGVNFIDQESMLDGKLMTDGTLTARVKSNLTENCTITTNALVTNERGRSDQGDLTVDYKGSVYRTQLQLGDDGDPFELGTNFLFKANYIQHVTPKLSLGGEVLWFGQPRRLDQPQKSVASCAARYETDKMIASGQVASSGAAIMNYVHKVTDKISLAAGFSYDFLFRDGAASVGYDIMLRESRVRGKINSNGVISVHVEEELCTGLGLLLSTEVDHVHKDYKFGFGVKYGYPPSQ